MQKLARVTLANSRAWEESGVVEKGRKVRVGGGVKEHAGRGGSKSQSLVSEWENQESRSERWRPGSE